jgi:hypothetical protein
MRLRRQIEQRPQTGAHAPEGAPAHQRRARQHSGHQQQRHAPGGLGVLRTVQDQGAAQGLGAAGGLYREGHHTRRRVGHIEGGRLVAVELAAVGSGHLNKCARAALGQPGQFGFHLGLATFGVGLAHHIHQHRGVTAQLLFVFGGEEHGGCAVDERQQHTQPDHRLDGQQQRQAPADGIAARRGGWRGMCAHDRSSST